MDQDKPMSDHDDVHVVDAERNPKDCHEHVAFVSDHDEERQLVRKIDMYLLPAIWGMYLLSYMDRTK